MLPSPSRLRASRATLTVALLLSSPASSDASLPDRPSATHDPLGLAGHHRLSGTLVEGTCHDLFFEMCMDQQDLEIRYEPTPRRHYQLRVGVQSVALRREGARLVGESARSIPDCPGAEIHERWSLTRTPDGRPVGDYVISQPERCPLACNARWELGRNGSVFRF